MGLCCYFGWWYQNDIRKRYKEIVEKVCSRPNGQPNATAMNAHVGGPPDDSSDTSSNDPSPGSSDTAAGRVTDDAMPTNNQMPYPQQEPTSKTALLASPEGQLSDSSSSLSASGALTSQHTHASFRSNEEIELGNRGPSGSIS